MRGIYTHFGSIACASYSHTHYVDYLYVILARISCWLFVHRASCTSLYCTIMPCVHLVSLCARGSCGLHHANMPMRFPCIPMCTTCWVFEKMSRATPYSCTYAMCRYGLCCHAMHAHVLHCTYCTRCGLHVMPCVLMCYAVSIISLMAIYIVPLLCPCVILYIPACCLVHMLLHSCIVSCVVKVFDQMPYKRL